MRSCVVGKFTYLYDLMFRYNTYRPKYNIVLCDGCINISKYFYEMKNFTLEKGFFLFSWCSNRQQNIRF